jgi:hypothetical protein
VDDRSGAIKLLYAQAALPAGIPGTPQYLAPGGTASRVEFRMLRFSNQSGVAQAIYGYEVPLVTSGGVPTVGNLFLPGVAIPANTMWDLSWNPSEWVIPADTGLFFFSPGGGNTTMSLRGTEYP